MPGQFCEARHLCVAAWFCRQHLGRPSAGGCRYAVSDRDTMTGHGATAAAVVAVADAIFVLR